MAKKLSKKLMKSAKGGSAYNGMIFVIDGRPVNTASVQVLEGAAATSIYGARAANGVIVITSADTIGGGALVRVRSTDATKK